jgi:hypothetical protein
VRLSASFCTVGSRRRISNRHVELQYPRGVPPTDDCGILDRRSRCASRSLRALSLPTRCVRARGAQVGGCGVHRSARKGPRNIIRPGGRWVVSRRAHRGAFPNSRSVTSEIEIAIIFSLVNLSKSIGDLLVFHLDCQAVRQDDARSLGDNIIARQRGGLRDTCRLFLLS